MENLENLDSVWGRQSISGEFFLNEGDVLDSKWKGGEFINAHISGGSVTCSLFENCTFKNTTFENVYMDNVDFVRCHFDNFKMINCSRDAMEMRECTGSPPTLIGAKEPRPGWENLPSRPPG